MSRNAQRRRGDDLPALKMADHHPATERETHRTLQERTLTHAGDSPKEPRRVAFPAGTKLLIVWFLQHGPCSVEFLSERLGMTSNCLRVHISQLRSQYGLRIASRPYRLIRLATDAD